MVDPNSEEYRQAQARITKSMLHLKAIERGEAKFTHAMTIRETCPECGNLLAKRKGSWGEFWGCTGYPNCRFTKKAL